MRWNPGPPTGNSSARLGSQRSEVQDFLSRYAGTYQEDRLRNDWLLLLGQRRDWDGFAADDPEYRMNDDPQVRCYAHAGRARARRDGRAGRLADEVRRNWLGQREADDGCLTAADRLIGEPGQHAPNDAWTKARLAIEANRPQAAPRRGRCSRRPMPSPLFDELNASPAKFLTGRVFVATKARKEMMVLALIKLAITDPDMAASQLESKWGPQLTPEERNWVWGVIGRQSAATLSPATPAAPSRNVTEERRPFRRHAGLEDARRAARRASGRTCSGAIERA